MSIYDILMLAVLVGSILFGLWKGLAWQVASLAAIFVSYFVALNFRGVLSGYISNSFAAMLILFLGTSLLVWLAYGYMKRTIERMRLRGFDAQAGAILGAFKGALLCMLITLFAVTLFGAGVRDSIISSRSGGYITAAINRLNAMVPSEIHAVLDKHVQEFNQRLDQHAPEFTKNSEDKFEQKFQTFRGKFKLPNARSSAPADLTTQQVFRNGDDNRQMSGDSGGSFRTPSNDRNIRDELLDRAREAVNDTINDQFNR